MALASLELLEAAWSILWDGTLEIQEMAHWFDSSLAHGLDQSH